MDPGIATYVKLIVVIALIPNDWFSNPRHSDADPKGIRKRIRETSMAKYIFLVKGNHKALKMGSLNPTKNQCKFKPGPQSVFL